MPYACGCDPAWARPAKAEEEGKRETKGLCRPSWPLSLSHCLSLFLRPSVRPSVGSVACCAVALLLRAQDKATFPLAQWHHHLGLICRKLVVTGQEPLHILRAIYLARALSSVRCSLPIQMSFAERGEPFAVHQSCRQRRKLFGKTVTLLLLPRHTTNEGVHCHSVHNELVDQPKKEGFNLPQIFKRLSGVSSFDALQQQ